MGNIPGKSELKFQLKRLLKEQGTAVKTKTLEDFLKAIETWSPWFVTSGAFNISEWEQVCRDLHKTLRKEGPEVQMQPPYSYLGFQIQSVRLQPQRLQMDCSHLQTLHDWQRLLGDVQWIRSSLSIPTGALKSLYDMLPEDPSPASPRIMTPAAKEALYALLNAPERAHLCRLDYSCPFYFMVVSSQFSPTGIFDKGDPFIGYIYPLPLRRW